MELIFRFTLFIAGLINIIPSFLTFFPNKISKSYGITIPDANFELLLRHRAVLFGIVGGFMIYSAILKKHFEIAAIIGLISMISFIVLYFLIDGKINSELKKVMIVDVVATIILLISLILYTFFSKNT